MADRLTAGQAPPRGDAAPGRALPGEVWSRPRPEDPIFFDPDADEPRPFDLDTATREMAEELRHAGIAARIAPSLIEAWCELGYVVTEDTRHLFSASDIAVWNEAVRRHAGDFQQDDDLNSDEVSHEGEVWRGGPDGCPGDGHGVAKTKPRLSRNSR